MPAGSSALAQLPRRLVRAAGPALVAAWRRFGHHGISLAGFRKPLTPLLAGDAARARHYYSRQVPAAELVDFEWLAHVEAADLELYRVFARNVLRQWRQQTRPDDFSVAVRRVLAFCHHGGQLLEGASKEFCQLLHAALAEDVTLLTRERVRDPDQAVRQAGAVLAAALCFGGPDLLRDEALRRLAPAAAAVILPDGGHCSRSPEQLLQSLALLVPIRHLLEEERLEVPPELQGAIERGIPMLRSLCHGDGGLCLLQGVSQPCPDLVAALLARDSVKGRGPAFAKLSGFARLQLGTTLAIVDCGPAARSDSMLAFELSHGPHRIVTSCGFPASRNEAWMAAAAGIAAHSTLEIQAPGTGIQSFLRRGRGGAENEVAAEVLTSPHGMLFKGWSTQHAKTLGLRHHREIFLASSGDDLRGEDKISRDPSIERGWPEGAFTLRFHLHPDVSVESGGIDKGSVSLQLPGGGLWQFSWRGGGFTVEESVFLATGGAPRKSHQLVIRGPLGQPDIVNWAFRRIS